MRFLFVDAENIGLKEVEAIDSSVADKTLVFTKDETIKQACERKLFLSISSYPAGPNQADFYIIGNLVGVIASLTEQQRSASQFVLYSQDNALVKAFSFQCKLHSVKHKVASGPKSQPKLVGPKSKPALTLEDRIYKQLQTEQTLESVRLKLKQPRSDFNRSVSALVREKKICRVSKSQKTWVRADCLS